MVVLVTAFSRGGAVVDDLQLLAVVTYVSSESTGSYLNDRGGRMEVANSGEAPMRNHEITGDLQRGKTC
jgi:hypothetical protein